MRQSQHRLTQYPLHAADIVAESSGHIGRLLHRRIALSGYGRGRFVIFSATLSLLEAHHMDASARARMRFYGDEPAYTLLRLEYGAAEWTEDGRTLSIQPGEGLLLSPLSRSLISWKGGFIAITIPAIMIEEAISRMTGHLSAGPLVVTERIDLRDTRLGAKVTYLVEQLEEGPGGVFECYPDEGDDAQVQLVERIIRSLPHNHEHLITNHHLGAARRHADDIEQFLALHGSDRVVTASTIAASIEVSDRTLRDVCQRIWQRTPVEVLRRWRLDYAYRRLRRPQPGDTVETVLYTSGFTGLRRAAEYYRKVYNERPAATLARALAKQA
jgi:AraC-like DNA-binding protein